ncbi:MAG: FGGY-family carbohydrate kinase [Roseovarius sp.]|nr:FGGY-family carbohydrate kinase [Roseovarius sp.]MCY4316383.1 FGGY-family carbohydrate kinase [Roseovarius sp.]
MKQNLVVGIDSSTSATKAIAWDRNGNFVCEGRESIPMDNPASGCFEQNPSDWWGSTISALKQVTGHVDARRVAAVSISNQRETFAVFSLDGTPPRPGIVWLDERAINEAEQFGDLVGRDRIRGICGKPVDALVPINRMIWIKNREPEIFAKIHKYSDVHGFLCNRLCNKWITSTASADPSGMLCLRQMDWSTELLDAAGIPRSMMPDLALPGEPVGNVTAGAAKLTGLIEGTPVIAGGGDGQCAATGAGAIEESLAYMNLGTAIVSGVYSSVYGHDQAFRTETAVSDEGYIFETVLKSGTFLIDWFARELAGGGENPGAVLKTLEAEASQSPIGANGIALLPFWQGSMTPHWDSKARGVIAGISGSSKRGDIYRALLEGLALDQAFALEKAMAAMQGSISRIIAIGGGTASGLLLQIVADSCNVPVCKAKVAEASSLGAAICAAKGAGWYGTIKEACKSMCPSDLTIIKPIEANVERYLEFRKIYDDLWPELKTWNTRLWDFANS